LNQFTRLNDEKPNHSRFCKASLEAPLTYISLIFLTIWGLVLFNQFPDFWTIIGALNIVLAGSHVRALGKVKLAISD